MHQYPTVSPEGVTAEGLMIHWQDGPVGQGFNGATLEVVVRAAIAKLNEYQAGPLACEENREALAHLHAVLGCLDRRTIDRYRRHVMGTVRA